MGLFDSLTGASASAAAKQNISVANQAADSSRTVLNNGFNAAGQAQTQGVQNQLTSLGDNYNTASGQLKQ